MKCVTNLVRLWLITSWLSVYSLMMCIHCSSHLCILFIIGIWWRHLNMRMWFSFFMLLSMRFLSRNPSNSSCKLTFCSIQTSLCNALLIKYTLIFFSEFRWYLVTLLHIFTHPTDVLFEPINTSIYFLYASFTFHSLLVDI